VDRDTGIYVLYLLSLRRSEYGSSQPAELETASRTELVQLIRHELLHILLDRDDDDYDFLRECFYRGISPNEDDWEKAHEKAKKHMPKEWRT